MSPSKTKINGHRCYYVLPSSTLFACKMDAESRKRRRESCISLREQRWSMSSQRLEQIVAALMKPVSHYGQSFDRDDSGLLEEYLTAAGLRALEAVEAGREPASPNYAEMGLVIQSFANNYSKKVDHLSRLVNNFSLTLDSQRASRSPPDADADADAEGEAPGHSPGARRSAGAAFAPIALLRHEGARRAGPPAGPPPTLPRAHAELQPRAPAAERALLDRGGEPIGSLDDFRVAWRLHEGFLVEDLASGATGSNGSAELRPLSLMELQEACARAAEPAPLAPHALSPSPPPAPSPPPDPEPLLTVAVSTLQTPTPPPAGLRRKRRSEIRVEDLFDGSFNIDIDEEVRKQLSQLREFSVSERWIRRVVRHRRELILSARRAASPPPREFRGFDMAWNDIGGFGGWEPSEAAAARGAVLRAAAVRRSERDSDDDDGFHERSSSLGDGRYSLDPAYQVSDGLDSGADSEAARAGPPLDLAALARDVRRALPAPPAALPWRALAAATHRAQPQPARVLLDVLCKATRGEVEIRRGEPLSVGEFSVRLLTDEPVAAVDEEDWPELKDVPPPPSPPPPSPPPGDP